MAINNPTLKAFTAGYPNCKFAITPPKKFENKETHEEFTTWEIAIVSKTEVDDNGLPKAKCYLHFAKSLGLLDKRQFAAKAADLSVAKQNDKYYLYESQRYEELEVPGFFE